MDAAKAGCVKGLRAMNLVRNAFKAYDIRGRVPEELNEDVVYRIGQAYAAVIKPQVVAIGHDIRLTGPAFRDALARGLTDMGCDVIDIGLCGTEEIYFAVSHLQIDGGIMITASHNPQDYNGIKMVKAHSQPISGDTELRAIEELVAGGDLIQPPATAVRGHLRCENLRAAYIQHILSYIDLSLLKPLKIVVNAGHGGAGLIIDELAEHLPFHFIKIQHEPDGTFPHGVPNPLLMDNRAVTAQAVREHKADLGIAWDGDFDRCFLFDEQGNFVEGYYIVGLLSKAFLHKNPGAAIIYDPRLYWNTEEIIRELGGRAVKCKTGHVFIKERMRQEDAVYGGEMSAHHYFKDFAYCDSGMISWLLVVEILCREKLRLGELIGDYQRRYPASGEMNRTVADGKAVLAKIEAAYAEQAAVIDKIDGLSMEFTDWRFNVRLSNTEPLLRLNVESRGDQALMEEKTVELLHFMETI